MNNYRARYLIAIALIAAMAIMAGCGIFRPQGREFNKEDIIKEIQASLPDVKPLPPKWDSENSFAGHFSSQPGFHGRQISLFPDKTFYIIDWSDVGGARLIDKGNWLYRNGLLVLQTDNSIKSQQRGKDKTFIPLYYPTLELFRLGPEKKRNERSFLIMGIEEQFPRFNKKPDTFSISLYSLSKIESADEDINENNYLHAQAFSFLMQKRNMFDSLAKAIELNPKCKEKAKKDAYFGWFWEDEEFKKLVN